MGWQGLLAHKCECENERPLGTGGQGRQPHVALCSLAGHVIHERIHSTCNNERQTQMSRERERILPPFSP